MLLSVQFLKSIVLYILSIFYEERLSLDPPPRSGPEVKYCLVHIKLFFAIFIDIALMDSLDMVFLISAIFYV